ncbi:MAG: hypothetical protein Q8R92_01875 [Deltaproteobacteria bacterium]|nr:hypothetical protein [Deltaproteobacteria bacterium]
MAGRLNLEQEQIWSSQSDDLSLAMWALAEEVATESLDRDGFLEGLRDVLRLLEAEFSSERVARVDAFAVDLLGNVDLLPFDSGPLVPLLERVSSIETLIGPETDAERVNGKIDEFLREVDMLIVEGD